MFGLLKGKLILIGGAVITFLLGVIKFQSVQNKRNKKRAVQAEKTLKFKEDVDTIDNEIDQEFSHRAEEAKQDVKEGKVPRNLSDPNDF